MASSSVEILLKARDSATPTINKASQAASGLKSSMGGASSSGSSFGRVMKGIPGPLAAVVAGLSAAKMASMLAKTAYSAFKNVLSEGLEVYATQEEAMRGNSEELQKFASELQVLTNIGDEVTLNAMQMARGMGVMDEDMIGVTQSAVALSEITGQSLESSMQLAVKGTEGYIEALQRQFPAMVNMETQAEKVAFANQKLAEGYEMAQQGTDTLEGAMKSLGNNWGDILERMGRLVAPFVKKIADWFNRISPIVQGVIDKAYPAFLNGVNIMAQGAAFLGEKLVYAFTFIEQAIANWKQVMAIAMMTVYLKIVGFAEDVKHFFTVAIPQYVAWFADNFLNIFRDMFVAYITMWQNRIQQVIDLVLVFWDVVTGKLSGGDAMRQAGEIAGRSLLEGFEASTAPLPKIAERQLTIEEKAVGGAIKALETNFLDKVNNKFEERMAGWKDTFTMELGEGAKEFQGAGIFDKVDDEKDKKKKGKEQKLAGVEARFLTRARQSPAEEKQDTMIQQQKDQIKGQREMIEEMKAQVAASKEIVEALREEMVGVEVVIP